MDKVIIVGVGVAVAIGTALYYLLTEKEEPQRCRSGNRSGSQKRSRTPPVSYADIRPEPGGKRKSVQSEVGPSGRGSLNTTELDNKAGQNIKTQVSPDSNKAEEESGSQPLKENLCHVCDKPANAVFLPCKHRKLCLEHAKHYFYLAEIHSRVAKCPLDSCRQELNSYYEY